MSVGRPEDPGQLLRQSGWGSASIGSGGSGKLEEYEKGWLILIVPSLLSNGKLWLPRTLWLPKEQVEVDQTFEGSFLRPKSISLKCGTQGIVLNGMLASFFQGIPHTYSLRYRLAWYLILFSVLGVAVSPWKLYVLGLYGVTANATVVATSHELVYYRFQVDGRDFENFGLVRAHPHMKAGEIVPVWYLPSNPDINDAGNNSTLAETVLMHGIFALVFSLLVVSMWK